MSSKFPFSTYSINNLLPLGDYPDEASLDLAGVSPTDLNLPLLILFIYPFQPLQLTKWSLWRCINRRVTSSESFIIMYSRFPSEGQRFLSGAQVHRPLNPTMTLQRLRPLHPSTIITSPVAQIAKRSFNFISLIACSISPLPPPPFFPSANDRAMALRSLLPVELQLDYLENFLRFAKLSEMMGIWYNLYLWSKSMWVSRCDNDMDRKSWTSNNEKKAF